jgi:hypothetical protein
MGCGASVQSTFTFMSRKTLGRPLARPAGRISSQRDSSEAVVAAAAPWTVAEWADPDTATIVATSASAPAISASAATASSTTALRLRFGGGRGQKHAGHGESADGVNCEKCTRRQHTRQDLPQNAPGVVGHHIRCLQFLFATAKPFQRDAQPALLVAIVSSSQSIKNEARRAPTQQREAREHRNAMASKQSRQANGGYPPLCCRTAR